MCVYMHMCACLCIYMCTHVVVFVCVHVCMCVCEYVSSYMGVHVHIGSMCACLCVYVCACTHTHASRNDSSRSPNQKLLVVPMIKSNGKERRLSANFHISGKTELSTGCSSC